MYNYECVLCLQVTETPQPFPKFTLQTVRTSVHCFQHNLVVLSDDKHVGHVLPELTYVVYDHDDVANVFGIGIHDGPGSPDASFPYGLAIPFGDVHMLVWTTQNDHACTIMQPD